MRIILFFAVTFFLNSSIIAQKVNNTTQNWLSYTDTTIRISVKYPPEWTLKTTNPKSPIVLKAPLENDEDDFAENINYVVKPLPQGQKVLLSDISKAIKNNIPNVVDEFKLGYEKKLQWMGGEAIEFFYSGVSKGDNAGVKIKLLQRIAIIKGNMYLATYSAENGKVDVSNADAIKIINLTTLLKK
ncbi:MAG: hypothetical protein KA319_02725 [Ferruginibacter sp.]|nr:hypothetical protein [Ferruginibacter sp.]